MLAMDFLQEGPNVSLSWLLYALLAFMVLVIVVGALTSRETTGPASKPRDEAEESAAKPKSPEKPKRSPSRKRSK